MSEQGPFDRILKPEGDDAGDKPADSSTRTLLIGMGILGVLLLLLVVSPLSPFGDGGDNSAITGGATQPSLSGSGTVKLANAPSGLEALSKVFTLEKPKDTAGPYALTLNLAQPVSDGRNLGLYTNRNGKWERVASGTLINNGTAVTGEVDEMPTNLAVMRRVSSAVQVSGRVASGAQVDAKAADLLTAISPLGLAPGPDGGFTGNQTALNDGKGNHVPVVRASSQADNDAVNAILASPDLREAHINNIVQLSLQPGNIGVEIDYAQVSPARKADFTSLVTVLAERLRQSNRSLSLSLPLPKKSGVSWDTGAYDWQELGKQADTLKLAAEPDPSLFFTNMQEVLEFLKSKTDLKKVVLTLSRSSKEKGTDGLRSLSLYEGLDLASDIEVRTNNQITANSSVVLVGKNIFQDDGASGLVWDEKAFAVSFTYPGRGGQRTVWLENALSIAFKLDLARRYNLGGVALDDVSDNPQAADLWSPLATYAENGSVSLVAPNGLLLRPTWQVQAGSSEAGTKGNLVWKAPAQAGRYDISLVVSDGVIRASQRIVLEVAVAGSTPAPTPARTATPTPRP